MVILIYTTVDQKLLIHNFFMDPGYNDIPHLALAQRVLQIAGIKHICIQDYVNTIGSKNEKSCELGEGRY